MSGSESGSENEGEGGGGSGGGGGGWSTFWKVAGAVAVVAGGIYSVGEGGGSADGGEWSTFWKVAGAAAVVAGAAAVAAVVVAGSIYTVLKEVSKQRQVAVEAGGSGGVVQPEVWTKPKVGWLKLNVDGSLLRETPSAGCGGVLRNDSEKWVKGFAQKLDPSLSADQTEKEGILKGLEWAKEKGVRKVEVESDHKVTVKLVNDIENESKEHYIVAIRKLLFSSDWQATLRWIPRPANEVAHELAGIASKELTSFHLKEFNHDDPPGTWMKALAKDSLHLY